MRDGRFRQVVGRTRRFNCIPIQTLFFAVTAITRDDHRSQLELRLPIATAAQTSAPPKLSQSTSASLLCYEQARANEPVSFWRENEIAVVILLRVFVRTA